MNSLNINQHPVLTQEINQNTEILCNFTTIGAISIGVISAIALGIIFGPLIGICSFACEIIGFFIARTIYFIPENTDATNQALVVANRQIQQLLADSEQTNAGILQVQQRTNDLIGILTGQRDRANQALVEATRLIDLGTYNVTQVLVPRIHQLENKLREIHQL